MTRPEARNESPDCQGGHHAETEWSDGSLMIVARRMTLLQFAGARVQGLPLVVPGHPESERRFDSERAAGA